MTLRKSFLFSVSVLALSFPSAQALAQNNERMPDMPEVSAEKLQKGVKQGWEETKETASETAKATEDLIEGTVITIQQALIDRENAITGIQTINYHPKHTANSIIGSAVYDTEENMVGNIEDILINKNGKTTHFIVGDGSVLSFGDKKVAFEYERIADKSSTGSVIAPITDDLIDTREPYNPEKHKGFSLQKMLEGEIISAGGQTMASIDNIVIESGHVTHIIAGFDKFLGFGGEQTALIYGTGTIAVQNNETDIVLDALQSKNFNAFQQAVSN